MKIRDLNLVRSRAGMASWPEGKFLIDTINAHSFVLARNDEAFESALQDADALLPDGISIVKACRWLHCENAPDEKIAGADLFAYEMENLNGKGGTSFFLGSTPETLALIEKKAAEVYPN
ncbi:MAG: WecB/TagA/CpsF family glycosyltransferase, partial [Bacteroidales bacterium]|nr:WecB/TagA/CpsF family glycosyltransferase [Bacteroidales bacterium]